MRAISVSLVVQKAPPSFFNHKFFASCLTAQTLVPRKPRFLNGLRLKQALHRNSQHAQGTLILKTVGHFV
jgi:hypothetical protein